MSDDAGIPVTFIPPESLTGERGVIWRARDGRRTTTQIAAHVRYQLHLTPHPANALGQKAILPPLWTATLAVPRRESYLHGDTEVVLTLDDGRQALGWLTDVRGWRTVRAALRIVGWLEDWQ